ncbi:glycoside hydrolase family 3 N-terminal domain-containing protein [Henriciella sp.]|uniref:glycoside hydrolase family 3 N-terminal domain-containing protein n=1 Tax=Henriciella sp. TaxID=1968823 RepID=UPI003C706CA0
MSVDQKLGQLVQAAGGRSKSLNSRLTDAELDRVRAGKVGSYLHVAGAEALGELQRVAVEESEHGIPLLFAMDVVHGYRTIFPVPIAIASSFDPSAWEEAARISADEATSAGLHWTFAPMVDIARDARWGRIVEGAGSDPYLSSVMAAAQVRGYQGASLGEPHTMLATAKHLGAYGAATGGRDYGSADLSERTLHEVYLPSFYAAEEAGVGSFMTAFNDIGGQPVTGTEALVDGILRDQWDFDGLVVSDWNAIAELLNHGVAETRGEAAVLALQAGVDMDMTSGVFETDLKAILDGNPALTADLDRAVGHILSVKERLGLFDQPFAYHDAGREEASLLTEENRAAARDIAARSMVLLKNESQTLPLSDPAGDILVIGTLADDHLTQLGSWRARGEAGDVISILDGLTDAAPDGVTVSYEPGGNIQTADEDAVDAAVQAAETAGNVILVIGEDYDLSGEARSRSSVELPAGQKALADAVLAARPDAVVLLVTGRAMAIPDIAETADTILLTWMLGVEAGPAVADVVYGARAPAGRLPVDFPRATGQLPLTYSETPSGRPANPDLSVDSNRYMDLPITPQFAFGHGLTYSTFSYGQPQLSKSAVGPQEAFSISVDITNTSDRDGEDVVQLYMRDPVSRTSRPKKELRGFKRVAIPAGQSVTVTFTLSPAQSATYDDDGSWLIEAGRLDFMIGPSSDSTSGQVTVEVTEAAETRVPAAAIETEVSVQ